MGLELLGSNRRRLGLLRLLRSQRIGYGLHRLLAGRIDRAHFQL